MPDRDDERRDVRVTIRMSAAERERMEAAAEADDRKLSDWMRLQLLRAVER